ncbi:TetR/AcrR family transcriptional regulator [Aeromicrobium sp. PE09-221]|uniref:TetR/AcrR family transcriptional regulator n=1 Tax=Aeromicrobium sp. PE09-221 TaxID=1898043 RepID=UPI001F3D0616|nr:TetR/AcrR family transcriptional regulator [Aeromicrobium sp. PE09-221]
MDESSEPKRRPGGRSARVYDAVVDATLAILLEHGYHGLTIRAVARTAGVAETTVYRRWPTPNHLTAAALLELAERDNPLPETGSLEGDLRALLGQIVALLNRPEVLRVVRSAAALDHRDDESVLAGKNAFFSSRFASATSLVGRAVERQEIPPDTDADLLIETLVAPAYMRALLSNRPLDQTFIEDSLRVALASVGRRCAD